jgi:hypothetical protein
VGTVAVVRDKIAAFRESGVTVLNVTPIASPADQPKLIEQLKTWTA